jgi:hypothetical protein
VRVCGLRPSRQRSPATAASPGAQLQHTAINWRTDAQPVIGAGQRRISRIERRRIARAAELCQQPRPITISRAESLRAAVIARNRRSSCETAQQVAVQYRRVTPAEHCGMRQIRSPAQSSARRMMTARSQIATSISDTPSAQQTSRNGLVKPPERYRSADCRKLFWRKFRPRMHR